MTDATWHGKTWSIAVGDEVTLRVGGATQVFGQTEVTRLDLRKRWWRWRLYFDKGQVARLPGLGAVDAEALSTAIRKSSAAPLLRECVAWDAALTSLLRHAWRGQRWITTEQRGRIEDGRPDRAVVGPLCDDHALLALFDESWTQAAISVLVGSAGRITELNSAILRSERGTQRQFLDSIEKQPLTEEQATAVLSYDSRVRVVAAAGSGKTSVMVARAAYAVHRGFTTPDRILMLAFNKNAAEELEGRVKERFAAAGISSDGVRASTFHALGLNLIGRATGSKPRVAPWVESQADSVATIARIVDGLRDRSTKFRYSWDLFRLVVGPAPLSAEGAKEPEWQDKRTKVRGFRTHADETVRSEGERMIADWLFLNGVSYQYERDYSFNTRSSEHGQYRPDYYYPDIDVWHEHWPVGSDGRPPASFKGYAADMEWKRGQHQQNQTELIETTWAAVMEGSGFTQLERELRDRGLSLDWNPDRASQTSSIKHEELYGLMRQVMAHVKSGSLTREEVDGRIDALPLTSQFRCRMFFDLYWPVHDEWERLLRNDGHVDFEDMLLQAVDLIEAGQFEPHWDLVLVDEVQDASAARARLVQALLRGETKHLLAVGDDWQSINRFAGADLSVMTDFARWFGDGPTVMLQTTFRCNQQIADVASAFVMKNERQLHKVVRAISRATEDDAVRLVQSSPGRDVAATLVEVLDDLAMQVRHGDLIGFAGYRVTVDVLGRFNFDRNLLPRRFPTELDVRFRTVHGSKGLEADVVILPRMVRGRHGFPSEIQDDPVLELATTHPDPFPYAEERRLFYVALTRARSQVILITESGKESQFLVELLTDGLVGSEGASAADLELCPKCGIGTVVDRSGPYGPFRACGRFPACDYRRSAGF